MQLRMEIRKFHLVAVLVASAVLCAILVLRLHGSQGGLPEFRTVPVPLSNVSGISFDGEHLWVTVDNAGKIYRIHPESGAVEQTLDFPVKATSGSAWDGEALWQVAYVEQRIYRLEVETGKILETIPTPGQGICSGMTFDGQHLWLANVDDEKIYQIDPTQDGKVLNALDSDFETTGLAWDGESLWNGVLVGTTEDHDEETPYTGFVQQRDLSAQETLQVFPVQGVFAGSSDWTVGEPRAQRMWWYDGYHSRFLEITLPKPPEGYLRALAVALLVLNLLAGVVGWKLPKSP